MNSHRSPGTTLIKNAAWVVAWDEASKSHVYRQNVDVAFSGDALTHVGPGFPGKADTVVDGSKLMVTPGFVNIHSHPQHEPSYRGLREEHGVQNMYMTGLFERSGAFSATDDAFREASFEVAAFEAALGFIDKLREEPSGRLSGVLSPMQIETCSIELLKDSFAAAQDRGLPYTVHIAQSVNEVQEIIRRHGKTSIHWAEDIGIRAPGTILGHAIFPDTHSWIRWWAKRDVGIIAATGCAVAHCPTPFSRYGQIMESFGDYVRAGITMGLGTDTTPHNMIEEMRKAMTFARIAARDIKNVSTAMMFHAATVGGADALMRNDLGRLAVGKKADLVLVDLSNPWMMPARDPLRSLIFHAADRAVKDVYIDGNKVVGDGKVLTLNHADAAARLTEAQARMMANTPNLDYKNRTADEIAPLSLALF